MSGAFDDNGPVSPKSKQPVRGPQVLPIPVEVSPCTNSGELECITNTVKPLNSRLL